MLIVDRGLSCGFTVIFITAALWFIFSRCQWARRSKADDVINLLSSRANDVLTYFFRHTTRTDFSSHFKLDFESRKCYFWKPGVGEKMIFHARANGRDQRATDKKKKTFQQVSTAPQTPGKNQHRLAFLAHFVKATENFHFSVIDFSFFFGSRRKLFIFVFCVSEKFVFRLYFLARNDLGCARSRSSNNK